ncbi:MAG: bifunctional hydroxymethylpyrimidine kinase/phosphomethylpyrimidine kinase [Pyrinomonadaceae bacterium]|nr:bifunctional hydroxymethylpyrimidine kinase/phosphomethylpyrimidine kinase [Pyrinomonadaceae bacterium]
MSTKLNKQAVCLTIAGLDPSGGAGIIADIKAFRAFGCFGTAAITSVTFQNTQGVYGAVHQTAKSVRGQVQPVIDDMSIAAVKTGMLPTGEVISETARLISENELTNVIVDPVVRSTSGFDLIDEPALRSLIGELFPLADLVTPNIPEAERIAGMAILTETDVVAAAASMRAMGARNVLIKGGHFGEERGVGRTARDFLFVGDKLLCLDGEYIETSATHGTGCTLAASIAANLAIGKDLRDAVVVAKSFVTEAIRTAPHLGRGNSPINI